MIGLAPKITFQINSRCSELELYGYRGLWAPRAASCMVFAIDLREIVTSKLGAEVRGALRVGPFGPALVSHPQIVRALGSGAHGLPGEGAFLACSF